MPVWSPASPRRYGGVEARVRIEAKWGRTSRDQLRERFADYLAPGDPRWKELALVTGDDYDVCVLYDRAFGGVVIDPSRTIVVSTEPSSARERLNRELPAARDEFLAFYDVERHHVIAPWHVTRATALAEHHKTRALSAIVSSFDTTERQRRRLAFVGDRLSALEGFDHFGRGSLGGIAFRGPLADKADGLVAYRYTFNAESAAEPGYFTEKLLDAILCETLCFYDGCPNVELYVDPDTFVRLDLDTPEAALDTVRAAIADAAWERRREAIQAQRALLVAELNPLEVIRRLVLGLRIDWRPDRAWHGAAPPPEVRRLDTGTLPADAYAPASAHPSAPVRAVDRRALLLDAFGTVTERAEQHLRPGDAVVLGGLTELPAARVGVDLGDGFLLVRAPRARSVLPSAVSATPRAARSLAAGGDLPRGGTLYAVWPPVAYVPGPLMRRDGLPDSVLPSLPARLRERPVDAARRARARVTRPTSRRRRRGWRR